MSDKKTDKRPRTEELKTTDFPIEDERGDDQSLAITSDASLFKTNGAAAFLTKRRPTGRNVLKFTMGPACPEFCGMFAGRGPDDDYQGKPRPTLVFVTIDGTGEIGVLRAQHSLSPLFAASESGELLPGAVAVIRFHGYASIDDGRRHVARLTYEVYSAEDVIKSSADSPHLSAALEVARQIASGKVRLYL